MPLDCGRRRPFDLRTPAGAQIAARRLKEAKSLAGLVLVLEGEDQSLLSGGEDVSAFLSGVFACLKELMSSKSRAFCLLLTRGVPAHTTGGVAGEGILGMFLAAAQEYPSVLFRTVALDASTDLSSALDRALDAGNPVIQRIYQRPGSLLPQGLLRTPVPAGKTTLELGPRTWWLFQGAPGESPGISPKPWPPSSAGSCC